MAIAHEVERPISDSEQAEFDAAQRWSKVAGTIVDAVAGRHGAVDRNSFLDRAQDHALVMHEFVKGGLARDELKLSHKERMAAATDKFINLLDWQMARGAVSDNVAVSRHGENGDIRAVGLTVTQAEQAAKMDEIMAKPLPDWIDLDEMTVIKECLNFYPPTSEDEDAYFTRNYQLQGGNNGPDNPWVVSVPFNVEDIAQFSDAVRRMSTDPAPAQAFGLKQPT